MICFECSKEIKGKYFRYANKDFCNNKCAEHMAETKHNIPPHAAKLIIRTNGTWIDGGDTKKMIKK